jgi:hypothetical protein
MRAAAEIQIRCAPDRAFDTLADMRNETAWNSGVSVAELRGDEAIAQGSRFHVVNNGTPYEVTIQTYSVPRSSCSKRSGTLTSRSPTA